MSHTYSESPGRALSHGATQFMSYICKKMSKSRFRDPSKQGFLRFSELGSPDYIVKSAIFSVWVFLMISVHGNTLYAIAIHKNRSITPFLTLWSHFENRTKKTPHFLQHLRPCHIVFTYSWRVKNPNICVKGSGNLNDLSCCLEKFILQLWVAQNHPLLIYSYIAGFN